MLKSITIENFFSFGKATKIELNAGLNILVGINASGKSTVIKALQLLYETVFGKGYEKLIMEDWGGFEAVKHQGIKKDTIILKFEFDRNILDKDFRYPNWISNPIYKLSINSISSHILTINDEIYTITDGLINEHLYTLENNKVIYDLDEIKTTVNKEDLLAIKHFFNQFTITYIQRQIENLKAYFCFDTSLKSTIRQPVAYTTENSLSATGENLTTVLQRIKNYYSLSYEHIETLLQKVNPNFKDISFDILGSRSILTLREKKLNRTILPEHISDGTLRFLLLLAITCNPVRGSLVCLDEPDMGLHPDMISTIADTLKEAAKTSQFIISTHSPLLLNEFDLEDIIVIEKDADNQSIAKTFNADDFAEWSNNYLAGQLWLMGKLGGKRW